MKILSIFDGISCARVALERAGIPVEAYYASEIDRYAMQISAKNYPDIVQLGSVVDFHPTPLICGQIDLMVGGFPCTDLSIAKKNRQGLKGEASGLFYEMIRIHKEVKPKFFIYENVASMSKENKEIILKTIQEIDPSAYVIMINASLVSAQNRKRLFFTNIPNVTQPEDRGILLKDILEESVSDEFYIKGNYKTWLDGEGGQKRIEKGFIKISPEKAKPLLARDYANWSGNMIRMGQIGKGGQGDRIYSPEGKSVGLSALGGGRGAKTGLYLINPKMQNFKKNYDKSTALTSSMWKEPPKIVSDETTQIRKLTPTECERLMGLDDGYTSGIINSQRYKMLGNSFNVDVVAHILSFIRHK